MAPPRTLPEPTWRPCEFCSHGFLPPRKKPYQVFCSRLCARRAWQLRVAVLPEYADVRKKRADRAGDTMRYRGEGKVDYHRMKGTYEHRYVMQQKLGRDLTSDDVVHHVDHHKGNNHPDNLELIDRAGHAAEHIMSHPRCPAGHWLKLDGSECTQCFPRAK